MLQYFYYEGGVDLHKEDHWAFHIKRIDQTIRKHTNNRLSRYNLTVAQIVALMNLYDRPDKQMTMKEMEKALEVAQSTTAGIIARLEQKGFVERFIAADDKRVKYVRITSTGMKYCLESEESMYEGEDMLLSGLSPEEQKLFCELLEKVSSSIKG